jgi:hypothetical protein
MNGKLEIGGTVVRRLVVQQGLELALSFVNVMMDKLLQTAIALVRSLQLQSHAQSCDTNYTYSWQIGNWSSCNATTCGASGTQTRTVTCKRSDGQTVADSFCGTKPATSQSCTGACTYTWAYGNWGPCSVTCGYGTQYRSVYCRNNAGQTVADSFCPAASRPAGSQSCYAGVPCGGGSGGGGVGGGGGPGGSGGPIVIK